MRLKLRYLAVWALVGTSIPINAFAVDKPINFPKTCIEGRLDNGLRYIVMPNQAPQNCVELRLVLRVGSMQQSAMQGGTAHFLEHMAFAGSKQYPGLSMIDSLETLGMQYGRDINAMTGFDKTYYMLTVPVKDRQSSTLSRTLGMLKEWLCNLTFTDEYIQKERGIILEELRQYDIYDPFYDLKMGNNVYRRKLPLGSIDDIQKVTKADLLDFYHRWYTPQLAAIVAVGNLDALKTVQTIQQLFGGIQPRKLRGYQVYPFKHDKGISISTMLDTLKKGEQLEVMVPHATVISKTITSTTQKLRGRMLISALNKRASWMQGSVDFSDAWYLADKNFFTLSLQGSNKRELLQRLERVVACLRHTCQQGFSEEEMALLISESTKHLASIDSEQSSEAWCEDFTDYLIAGDRKLSTPEDVELVREQLAKTTAQQLQTILTEWLKAADQTKLVSYVQRSGHSLTKQEIAGIWHRAKNQKVEPYVYTPHVESVEEIKPTPECLAKKYVFAPLAIAKETHYPQTNTYDIVLKNGLRLVLRPTRDESGIFTIEGFGRGGTADLPDSTYHQYAGTAGYIDMGGLAKVPYEQLSDYMAQSGLSLGVNIASYWHGFIGNAPATKAQEMLNLIAEKTHHPEVNETEFNETKAEEVASFGTTTPLQMLLKQDANRMLTNLRDSIMGDAPSMIRPRQTCQDLERQDIHHMTAYFKSLYADPAQLTIVIAGDFDADSMKQVTAATLGSLQSHNIPTVYREVRNVLLNQRTTHVIDSHGDEQTTLHILLSGNYEPSLRTTLTLKLMRELLQKQLIDIIRRRENLTYSPFTDLAYHGIDGHSYYFDLILTLDEANVGKAEKLIQGILTDLQTHKVKAETLENIKRSFRMTKAKTLTDDATGAWRGEIVGRLKNGESLADFENYDELLSSITPDDVLQAFKRYIHQKTITILKLKGKS